MHQKIPTTDQAHKARVGHGVKRRSLRVKDYGHDLSFLEIYTCFQLLQIYPIPHQSTAHLHRTLSVFGQVQVFTAIVEKIVLQ